MLRYDQFIQKQPLRRAVVLGSVVVLLWLVRSVMNTILLTFIFAFLVTRVVKMVRRYVNVRPIVVVAPLYLLVVGGMSYAAIHYVPMIANQTVNLFNTVMNFYNSADFTDNATIQWVVSSLEQFNLKGQIQASMSAVLQYVGNLGAMGVTLLISLILSFFFSMEVDELHTFGQSFLDSPFGWYFADLGYFADKFINTFGVVIEAQILIAVVNTVITTLTLIFLHMPNIPSLAVMVFLLSMIPVAGAIISVVPLAAISYTVDGWKGVITILVMIAIIHVLEAYILNPKFMSSRTKLPVFFTFVVLLGAEELFGTWGLIVGIPIFTFLLDVIGVRRIHEGSATEGA